METTTLNIEAMSCSMCVRAVTDALVGLDGVQAAEVSLEDNQAVVTYHPAQVQKADMLAAIEEEGYAATPAD